MNKQTDRPWQHFHRAARLALYVNAAWYNCLVAKPTGVSPCRVCVLTNGRQAARNGKPSCPTDARYTATSVWPS